MFSFLAETFVLGLKNLRLHKLRTMLTALGIILGVAAVIIMVAIGEGAKQAALAQLRQLGATNILVRSKKPPDSSEANGRTQRAIEFGLKRSDLARLETIPGVHTLVPLRDTEQNVTYGQTRAQANAIGTTPDIFRVTNLRLERGRYFTPLDYDDRAAVCVIGSSVAQQLFAFEEPLGRQLKVGRMNTVLLTIVGVLEPVGLRPGSAGAEMMQRDLNQAVYFPLTLARNVFGDTVTHMDTASIERKVTELTDVWMQADRMDEVEAIASVAENIVATNHPQKDFEVAAPIQILRNAEQTERMFNFIMVGIASFSLVVGGIGIMNIMLANVTERTREIGIRRALGAKRRHITLQFLIETTVISLTGGLAGIVLGAGVATLLPIVARQLGNGNNYPTMITTWSVVGSFAISGMIGIGFGLYPAVMAARMNPIDALRHE